MNQQLELVSHRVDLRYGLVRFIAWIVPMWFSTLRRFLITSSA